MNDYIERDCQKLDDWLGKLRIASLPADDSEVFSKLMWSAVQKLYDDCMFCGVCEVFCYDDTAEGGLQGQLGGFLWAFNEDGDPITGLGISKRAVDQGESVAIAVLLHQLAHAITLRTDHGRPFHKIRAGLRQEWEETTGLVLSHEDMAPHIELGYMKQERTGA